VQVDFNAKNEYDMINNYKVMQDVFNKLGVEKVRKQRQHVQQQLSKLQHTLASQLDHQAG
jgi:histidyl-tRNA synthetase